MPHPRRDAGRRGGGPAGVKPLRARRHHDQRALGRHARFDLAAVDGGLERVEQTRGRPVFIGGIFHVRNRRLRQAEKSGHAGLGPAHAEAKRLDARQDYVGHDAYNKKLIVIVNKKPITPINKLLIMVESPHDRLKAARLAAGFETAASAALAMGVKAPTYTHHENGTAGLSRSGERYARFFRVSLDWLLTGRGEMKMKRDEPGLAIPILGVVGAGAGVEMIEDEAGLNGQHEIQMPAQGNIGALVVRGDSQYPRFRDGEIILFDPRPALPETLQGRYAVVQTVDGRRLIKILRRSRAGGDNRWTLESHNAPPEENVQLLGAWRYIGVLQRD